MKKINILLISLMALTLGACKKFMDRDPLSKISPDNYFTTEKDLKLYINSMYSMVPDAEGVYNEDLDNVVKSSTSEFLTGRRQVPVTGGGWSWSELRKINYFLVNCNRVLPYSTTRKYVGAAKFFRAWFYFEMVRKFGDVPWYTTPLDVNDPALQKGRDPRKLVMDSVMADIDSAIVSLDATKSNEQVNKWTALALKSRICLFEGTFRKYHKEFNLPDENKFLQAAADAAALLMAGGQYRIYTSTSQYAYRELFSFKDANPDEIILTRRFSGALQIYHNANYYTITASYGQPGLEKSFVNSYLMKDGSRFTDKPGYDKIQFYEECQNRDPRLAQTIRTPGYTRIGNTNKLVPDFGAAVTGYQLIKYVTDETHDSYTKNDNDMPIFRYAEALLNYAEAKAELGQLTQADIDQSIKLLRDRVGMPNLNVATANANPDSYEAARYGNKALSGALLEIRRERRIELVMENFRWSDLCRWKEGALLTKQFKGMYFPGTGQFDLDNDGKIDVVIYEGTKPAGPKGPAYLKLGSEINLENGNAGGYIVVNRNITKEFNENRDYLYPVPIQERTLNKNLTQNPNWNDGL
ncbi:MAG TPA: RagB/SusD family nutrient uptake outer membrane protein [Chitinophaga sp.]|uniref:RagB/SusD family nutrient uptake outer membrane protein n=1 Tax=Chitinophaga sp. TaxID=1869181 RepID=UPI002B8D72C7|nr:RagB/SusD family nutrient uptake outer membrane protein [Chitinophaga sp.]HVI46663.1 RagB/SusD family nutrient uptake outer membrane protein [Chitinophaga sp.]